MFSALALILLASRLQPPPPQITTLRLTECQLPCWIGIIPGETTLTDAQTLLRNAYPAPEYTYSSDHNLFEDTNWLTVERPAENINFAVNFNHWQRAGEQTGATIVSQITIINTPVNLRLGDWYTVLGAPQALSISWGNYTASPNLLYDQQQVRLTLFNAFDSFAVNSAFIAANSIDIYGQVEMQKNYHPEYRAIWHGFLTSNKANLMALMLP
jgi:hypothetical protein